MAAATPAATPRTLLAPLVGLHERPLPRGDMEAQQRHRALPNAVFSRRANDIHSLLQQDRDSVELSEATERRNILMEEKNVRSADMEAQQKQHRALPNAVFNRRANDRHALLQQSLESVELSEASDRRNILMEEKSLRTVSLAPQCPRPPTARWNESNLRAAHRLQQAMLADRFQNQSRSIVDAETEGRCLLLCEHKQAVVECFAANEVDSRHALLAEFRRSLVERAQPLLVDAETVQRRALQQLSECDCIVVNEAGERDVLLSQYYRGLIDTKRVAVAAEEATHRGRQQACEAECRLALCRMQLEEKSLLMVADEERALRPATANEEATERRALLLSELCAREAKLRPVVIADEAAERRALVQLSECDCIVVNEAGERDLLLSQYYRGLIDTKREAIPAEEAAHRGRQHACEAECRLALCRMQLEEKSANEEATERRALLLSELCAREAKLRPAVIADEAAERRALLQLSECDCIVVNEAGERDVLLSQYHRGFIDAKREAIPAEEATHRGRQHACEAECRFALYRMQLEEKSLLMVADEEIALRPATAKEEATERRALLLSELCAREAKLRLAVIADEAAERRALVQLSECDCIVVNEAGERDLLLSQYYRGFIDTEREAIPAEEATHRGRQQACEAECRLALYRMQLEEKSRLMVADEEIALRPATAKEEATERRALLLSELCAREAKLRPVVIADEAAERAKRRLGEQKLAILFHDHKVASEQIYLCETKQRCELLTDYLSAQYLIQLTKSDAERRQQRMEMFYEFAQLEEQILQRKFGDGSSADAEPLLAEAPPDAELSYVFERCSKVVYGVAMRRQMAEWHSKLEQLANESVQLNEEIAQLKVENRKCNDVDGPTADKEPRVAAFELIKRLNDCISEYEHLKQQYERGAELRRGETIVYRNCTKDCIFSLYSAPDVVERELLPGEEYTICNTRRISNFRFRSIGCALGTCVRDLIEREEAATEKYKGLPLEGAVAMCIASHACEGGSLKFVDWSFYKPSLPRDDDAPELTFLRPCWLRPWGLPVALCLPFSSLGPFMSEVCQGGLGDCWMMSTLASIAHSHPELIRAIFFPYPMRAAEQRVGAFRLLLCVDGWWRCVVVDDLLPADATSLRYGHCNAHPGVLWVPLIEKAMAKVFGGYDALQGNDSRLAFQYLLGLPSKKISFDDKDPIANSFEDMRKLLEAKHCIVLGSRKKPTDSTGHAYTLHSAGTNAVGAKVRQHLCIRNPHDVELSMYWESVPSVFDDGTLCRIDPALKYTHSVRAHMEPGTLFAVNLDVQCPQLNLLVMVTQGMKEKAHVRIVLCHSHEDTPQNGDDVKLPVIVSSTGDPNNPNTNSVGAAINASCNSLFYRFEGGAKPYEVFVDSYAQADVVVTLLADVRSQATGTFTASFENIPGAGFFSIKGKQGVFAEYKSSQCQPMQNATVQLREQGCAPHEYCAASFHDVGQPVAVAGLPHPAC